MSTTSSSLRETLLAKKAELTAENNQAHEEYYGWELISLNRQQIKAIDRALARLSREARRKGE